MCGWVCVLMCMMQPARTCDTYGAEYGSDLDEICMLYVGVDCYLLDLVGGHGLQE